MQANAVRLERCGPPWNLAGCHGGPWCFAGGRLLGGGLGFVRLGGGDLDSHGHQDAEAADRMAANAGAQFIAEAESASDFTSLRSCHAACASRILRAANLAGAFLRFGEGAVVGEIEAEVG